MNAMDSTWGLADSPARACLAMIERHAPRLMRSGGGSLGAVCVPRRWSRLNQEMRARVLAKVAEGLSRHKVAAVCGVAPSSVTRICNAAGIAPAVRGQKPGAGVRRAA
jgi:hypothetical protein